MCGVIGLVLSDPEAHVAQALVDGLTILQHRGQDAAGIVTASGNRFNLRKDTGLVSEVFTQQNIVHLKGNRGIGHVRYPTAGTAGSSNSSSSSNPSEAQPFYASYPFGIALAHNGNLTNTADLLLQVQHAHRHVNTASDSELLLNIFADELGRRNCHEMDAEDVLDTVRIVMRKVQGALAVIVLINGVGMLAFRDPHGIRPLCYGSRQRQCHDGKQQTDYAIASESVAIDALDPLFVLQGDVGPGEAIFISQATGILSKRSCASQHLTPCLFEYVYFARPDSVSASPCACLRG